jgi:hypothetical protein
MSVPSSAADWPDVLRRLQRVPAMPAPLYPLLQGLESPPAAAATATAA